MLQGEECGRPEQQHFSRGVEAQAEQEPDRVELPLLADRAHPPAEEPVEEAPVVQLPLELGLVKRTPPHRPEDANDAGQDEQVQPADKEQERGRDQRAEQRAELLQPRARVEDLVENDLLRDHDSDAHRDNDRGVAEREEVTEAERPWLAGALPVVHLLASGVVDDRDVVGVERMAKA